MGKLRLMASGSLFATQEIQSAAVVANDATGFVSSGNFGSTDLPNGWASMTRETILSNTPPPEDDDPNLRPMRMDEMIGQKDVIARLKVAIDAAKQRDDVLGHILFDGPPGLGKTTFAHCIPNELGVPVDLLSGPSLKAPKDLSPQFDQSAAQTSALHR